MFSAGESDEGKVLNDQCAQINFLMQTDQMSIIIMGVDFQLS